MSWFRLVLNKLVSIVSGQEEIKRLIRLGNNRREEIAQNLTERLIRIESLLTPPPVPTAPDPITAWRLTGERKDGDMFLLTYEAELPPVPDVEDNKDVTIQRIGVYIDGNQVGQQDLPRLAEKVTFETVKGKTTHLTRQLIDDDGNSGDVVASQDFVAVDTIRPTAPGDFGKIRLLGEREVPDEPTPTPTPVPEPTPEPTPPL
jgi:hypothetical protein